MASALTLVSPTQANFDMQFGIRSLLVMTAIASLGIPALWIPGGVYYYLPLLWILLVSLLFIALVRQRITSPHRNRYLREYPLMAVGILLLFSVVSFVLMSDVAIERFATLRGNEEGRARALAIKDPERFRDICLNLRTQLMMLPIERRVLSGQSPELPEEIRAMQPIRVSANENFIDIQLTQDGGVLVAYPLDGSFPHVSSRRLANCLYFWPE